MINIGQTGVASVAVVVAVVAVAGGAVGTPVAVDSVADQQPGSPLYGLERAGESIKEATYAGGQGWDLARAGERTQEYRKIVKENLVHDHTNLLEEAGNRLMNAIKKSGDNKGLQRAENRIRKHLRVLENLRERENIPEHARLAISLAISRSVRSKVVINDIQADNLPQPAKGGGPVIAERLDRVRDRVQKLKEEVEENRAKGQPASEIIQNIEIGTGKHLMEKFRKMANQGVGHKYAGLVSEAENRFVAASKAAENASGLERAVEVARKHLSVLENLVVENKIPEVAEPAIYHAMEKSARHIGILENLIENENVWKGPPQDVPGMIKSKIKKGMGPLKEDIDNALERVRERIENKIKEAENQIAQAENQLGQMENELGQLENQVENQVAQVENELEQIENQLGQTENQFENEFGQP